MTAKEKALQAFREMPEYREVIGRTVENPWIGLIAKIIDAIPDAPPEPPEMYWRLKDGRAVKYIPGQIMPCDAFLCHGPVPEPPLWEAHVLVSTQGGITADVEAEGPLSRHGWRKIKVREVRGE